MLHIDRHHDSQLAAHLSRLDYDSYVSDTADEIIADSILDDIMHRLSIQAQDEIRRIVLEMAEERIKKEREDVEKERAQEERFEREGRYWD